MAGGGASEDGDIGFQIAPMVDVVFVLLLFFMAAAGSQQVAKELTSQLPGAAAPIRQDLSVILIDILPDGNVQMNGRTYDSPGNQELPELRGWFRETIARFGDSDPVVIRPHPDVPHQRVIDVLNSAAAAGVKNLTFS